jgi:5'-deoxynucleotidase
MPFQRELRDLAFVPRWSIVRVARTQSVAEHSYYTAMYAGQICDFLGLATYKPFAVWQALWHDAEECFTSDIPGPVKHELLDEIKSQATIAAKMTSRFGLEWIEPKALTPEYVTMTDFIVKVASLVDDALFLAGEIQRGNKATQAAMRNVMERLHQTLEEPHVLRAKWDDLIKVLDDAILHEMNGTSIEPDA